jgi:hypothetical protein
MVDEQQTISLLRIQLNSKVGAQAVVGQFEMTRSGPQNGAR